MLRKSFDVSGRIVAQPFGDADVITGLASLTAASAAMDPRLCSREDMEGSCNHFASVLARPTHFPYASQLEHRHMQPVLLSFRIAHRV